MEMKSNTIKDIVKETIESMHERASNISKLSISLEDSMIIVPGSLQEEPPLQVKEYIETLKAFKGNRLYRFSIPDESDINQVVDSFGRFHARNKKRKRGGKVRRNLSKWNKNNVSNTIYFGSKKDNIHKRFEQHLGYGYNRTFSLHLRFWLPEDVPVKFELYKIENAENQMTLEDIEQAVGSTSSQFLGKGAVTSFIL